MSENAYHDDFESVSKTMLAHFHSSPHEYFRYYVSQEAKPPRPKSVVVGAVAHEVLLKDKQLADVALLYPTECLKSNGAINPKPAREWEQSLGPDQHAVKQQVFDQIDALLSGIKGHPMVQLIAQADTREQPIYWTDEDTQQGCKCRPDFLCLTDEAAVCYDPKFTSTVKPWEFWRTAKMFKYWMQDAHYSAGVRAKYGMPCRFVFWAVEDTAPYRIARYEYTTESRENAAIETAATLGELAARRAGGNWKDNWTSGTNELFFEPRDSNLSELDWSESGKQEAPF